MRIKAVISRHPSITHETIAARSEVRTRFPTARKSMRGESSAAAALLCCLVSASAQPVIPGQDGSLAAFTHVGNMNFDRLPGGLEITRFEIRSLLTEPLSPADRWTIQPVFDCQATILRFNQVPTSIFFDPESLHSFNVYPTVMDFGVLALSISDDSPWIHGMWGDAHLATDFWHLVGKNLTYQLAGGTGYRFNENFTFGIGGAITQPNRQVEFHPGIGLDWIISDQIHVGACGPAWFANYQPDEDWQLSLRGDSASEFWNISDNRGRPLSINLSSYQIGLFASRRLTGQLWFRAGAGVTVANEFQLNDSHGDKIVRRGLDSGLFGQISLTIGLW